MSNKKYGLFLKKFRLLKDYDLMPRLLPWWFSNQVYFLGVIGDKKKSHVFPGNLIIDNSGIDWDSLSANAVSNHPIYRMSKGDTLRMGAAGLPLWVDEVEGWLFYSIMAIESDADKRTAGERLVELKQNEDFTKALGKLASALMGLASGANIPMYSVLNIDTDVSVKAALDAFSQVLKDNKDDLINTWSGCYPVVLCQTRGIFLRMIY